MKKIYLSIIWLLLLLTGCHEQELLKNLDQNQANEVIALLQQNNIDAYKKESAKSGYIIYIEKEDFIPAVDLINRYGFGLPRKPRLEIARMFPSDSLVSSPLAEKARLYSGIEQRLAQSLHSIEGIVTAHVHISYELNSIESKKEQKYHVSALIKYNDTIKDVNLLINDIKRFLKNNSVNGVSYDDISVVTTEMEQINRLKLTSSHQGATSGLIWLFSANVFIILIIFFLFFLINKNRKTPALLTMNNNLVTNFIKEKLIMKDRSNK